MSGRGKGQKKGKPRTSTKSNHQQKGGGGRNRNVKKQNTNDNRNSNKFLNRNKKIKRKELHESNGRYKFSIALPIGADPNSIIEHINKTEGMTLSPQEQTVSNAKIYFYITDQLVATSLFRLNRVKYNGQMLNIESLKEVTETKVSDKDIESIIQYDSQSQCLDLSSLAEKIDFNHQSIIGRLAKIFQSKYAESVSLNMAKNRITNLKGFWKLAKALKNLKNLCLEENEIASFDELKGLTSFRSLELLILAKNPLCWDNNSYKETVRKTLPTLKCLDMKDITNPTFVCNYFENAQQEEFVINFVKRLLEVFDNERAQLQTVYSSSSTFSFLCSSAECRSFAYSRNLLMLQNAEARSALLKTGMEQIINFLFAYIPRTVHDMGNLVIESFMISQNLLSITVHGNLGEPDTGVIRRFNRVLLISPALPNSIAANAGWMGVIEKDVLHFGVKTN